MSSKDEAATDRESHHARYCESCGQLIASTEKIRENVEEPVHRVEILRAVGDIDEVGETTAVEEGECDDCGGQLVKRYYAYPASAFEEPDFEPDEDEFAGRDPEEDALMALTSDPGPEDYEEVREMSWIKGGNANGA